MSKVIAVFGATGQQGGGVLKALQAQGEFRTRAVTRDPAKAAGLADEVVQADLTKPDSLNAALDGAYGVFLVTNFWDGADVDEFAQGRAAAEAARRAGVGHFIWSTLPNVERIANGRFVVPHFTTKARVNELVTAAGFEFHTFVEAPFYFQNLTGQLAPQPGPDGTPTWALPMDPENEAIHMGDIAELGHVVAGAFAHPERVGSGQTLAHAAARYSWNDIVETLSELGRTVAFQRVPGEVFDDFFPGARELREMMQYFEEYTYLGPDAEQKLGLAREVTTQPPSSFEHWARQHMVPSSS